MIKTKFTAICAATTMAMLGTASAAEIEVYGIVDSYVQYYNDGSDSLVGIGSGGKAGSRFGFRGSEELGGGTSVFFRLENGFFLDNGTNTTAAEPDGWAFQREAVLGIKNDRWGSLSFGRQYTLNFGNAAMFDAFALSLGSTLNNFMSPVPLAGMQGINGQGGVDNATRRDNSILYQTPSMGGLTVSGMVSLGEQKKLSGEQSNTLGNSYSLQAVYRAGAFATGLSWLNQSMAAKKDEVFRYAERTTNNTYNLGASYDFGVTKLYGNFIYKKGEHDTPNSVNPTLYVYGVSLATPLAGGKLLNGFTYVKNDTQDKADAWNISARYDYPLSKRTTIYGGAAYMHNDDNTRYTINGGGGTSSAPGTNAMGESPWTFFTGISHSF